MRITGGNVLVCGTRVNAQQHLPRFYAVTNLGVEQNDVEAVNQYAATMYSATAAGTLAGRARLDVAITSHRPNIATTSLISSPELSRA